MTRNSRQNGPATSRVTDINVSIVQWNLAGFQRNKHHLAYLKSLCNPLIFALQETHLTTFDDIIDSFAGYKCLLPVSSNRYGGVGFLINPGLMFSVMQLNSPLESVAILTALPDLPGTVTLVNLYIPPSFQLTRHILNDLLRQLTPPFIILGDFNARSEAWGDHTTKARGRLVESWVDDNAQLCIMNDGSATFFGPMGSQTCPDLSIADNSLAFKLQWSIGYNPKGCDHHPIVISITPRKTKSSGYKFPQRFVDKSADWAVFSSAVDEFLSLHRESDNINKEASVLTKAMRFAASKSMKVRQLQTQSRTPQWVSSEVKTIARDRDRVWRSYKRNPSQDKLLQLKRINAILRKTIKSSRKNAWNEFVNGIDGTDMSETWRKANRILKGGRPGGIMAIRQGDVLVTDPGLNAEYLATRYEAQSPQCRTYGANYHQPEPLSQHAVLDLQITTQELVETLNAFRGSTPAMDGVTYDMVKHASASFTHRLSRLYNRIYLTGQLPQAWKMAQLCPIRKPGKDPSQFDSYRYISLLPVLSKILEKIVARRLSWFMETLLPDEVHGFRRRRGPNSLLQTLDFEIGSSLDRKIHCDLVSCDLEKAFDQIPKRSIVQQLIDWGVGRCIPRYVYSFLSNRKISLLLKGHLSLSKRMTLGIPQGSPLSVHLFNCYIYSLSTQLSRISSLSHFIYADNIILLAPSIDEGSNEALQEGINSIISWTRMKGGLLAPSKSEAIHFCRKHSCRTFPINQYNSPIPFKDNIKILGLNFTQKLSYTFHCHQVIASLRKSNSLLRYICRKTVGPPVDIALRIAKSIQFGKLDYCFSIYGFTTKSNLNKLQIAINQSARIALGALRCTKVTSLIALANFPMVRDRRNQLAMRLMTTGFFNPLHPLHNLIINIITESMRTFKSPALSKMAALIDELEIHLSSPPTRIDMVPHWTNWKDQVHLDLASLPKNTTNTSIYRKSFLEHRATLYDTKAIYTDASMGPSGVIGIAVLEEDDLSLAGNLPPHSSVFTGELLAIFKAITSAENGQDSSVIYSDSLSALKAILNTNNDDHLVTSIRRKLYENIGRISLYWIPGHVGIGGNERADREAKLAARSPLIVLQLPSQNHARSVIARHLARGNQTRWSSDRSFLHHHAPIYSDILPFTGLSREMGVKLSRVRLGCTLATHLHLYNSTPAPGCRHCSETLSIRHAILECPSNSNVSFVFSVSPMEALKLDNSSKIGLIRELLVHHGLWNNI